MIRIFAKYEGFLLRCLGLAVALAALSSFTSWAQVANAHDEQVQAEILNAQRATQRGSYATDGVFQGEAEGYGGPVCVQVTIDNGFIAQVELISAEGEDQAWLNMALPLLDAIAQEQTTQIDVVSGATFSSSGILNGATRALEQSGLAASATALSEEDSGNDSERDIELGE